MKKNIGSQLALYPTPVTLIEAMNGDKLTWTFDAFCPQSIVLDCD